MLLFGACVVWLCFVGCQFATGEFLPELAFSHIKIRVVDRQCLVLARQCKGKKKLPLRDPPMMAGSYGVPLNNPVFGISSGSIPCENPGHRPIPAPTPPPPPAGSAGVKDPYVHLLESQSAMSMLMMQMAREMNQRSLQQRAP